MNAMLPKIHEAQLELLNELDRICKEQNITYFLTQGTLLGAAKYQGFIPWDDDADVMIPFDELKKLTDVFEKEAKEKFFLTDYRKEECFPLPWAKVRNKNTLSRPVRYKDMPINWGICIDVFPYYPMSNSKIKQKLQIAFYKLARKMLMSELAAYEENPGKLDRLFTKLPRSFRHKFMDTAIRRMEKNAWGDKVYVTSKGGRIVDRSLLSGEATTLPFEGKDYPVPNGYDAYLTLNYGDYMKPLPKDVQEREEQGHEKNMGSIEWRFE